MAWLELSIVPQIKDVPYHFRLTWHGQQAYRPSSHYMDIRCCHEAVEWFGVLGMVSLVLAEMFRLKGDRA